MKVSGGKYCGECSTFCRGCNPETPSYFSGPMCQNCQHLCPMCMDFRNTKIEKHPGDKYCVSCLHDLCCGMYRRDNKHHHDLCLACRIGKKCTIPCCQNLVYGRYKEKCQRCETIAHDLFHSYGPRPFNNSKLGAADISTKYSVTVRYEEVVEEHDGYCSDPVDKFDYHRVIESIIPLPSMLDDVVTSIISTYRPSDDGSDRESDDERSDDGSDGESDDDFTIYRPSTYLSNNVSGMEKSFPSTYMCDWIDGTPKEHSYDDVNDTRHKMKILKGPMLPSEYHYFYSTTDSCKHGSGYCGRHTIYTPLIVKINVL
jgi:hypothetical protein